MDTDQYSTRMDVLDAILHPRKRRGNGHGWRMVLTIDECLKRLNQTAASPAETSLPQQGTLLRARTFDETVVGCYTTVLTFLPRGG